MSTQITERIYHIEVPMKGGSLTALNSYLILGNERNLLIDAGYNKPESSDVLIKEMKQLGADFNNTDIFLTHMHVDHAEFAVTLNKTRGVKVYIGDADGKRLENMNNDNTSSWTWTQNKLLRLGFPPDEMPEPRPIDASKSLYLSGGGNYTHVFDGDKLHYGGYELVCIDAAGHSPGQTCLYIPEKKLVFFGDHILYSITPNITSWDISYNPLKNYIKNLKKFKDIEIEIPLPAHRKVVCNIYDRIDQILEHHRVRLDETLDAIRTCHGATPYEIASRLHWNVHNDRWEDFPTHQKASAVGEVLAHLAYLVDEGKVKCNDENGQDKFYIA